MGASPLLSGLFHELTVEALNVVGIDVSGVGNHEFDEGLAEIYRLLDGGCHPVDGCQDGDAFLGAIYRYLAANVFFFVHESWRDPRPDPVRPDLGVARRPER